ncbi:hypothetical protein [Ruegeria sp. PrR005]|uniref:Uncharacterized protein n=1 Tax=Ruegeria sp. PrR005 TaxID=2706882 RepID=A0A6B2NJN7_9RHOB|nr:hypothetical protein [Ruegeria sp. PrR005]NDW44392.1 hypothetical protein [Ruegeria sp. PrR005]
MPELVDTAKGDAALEIWREGEVFLAQCENTAELLHFFLHASDTVAFLRNRFAEGGQMKEPAQLYSLLSVLDDAMNGTKRALAESSIHFLETLAAQTAWKGGLQ